MEERRAVAEILKPEGEETNVEAAQRLVDSIQILLGERNALTEILKPEGEESNVGAVGRLKKEYFDILTEYREYLAGANDAGAHAGSTPAPATIEDDDPADPRPAMNPLLGWNTPEVVEWVNRRRSRNNA